MAESTELKETKEPFKRRNHLEGRLFGHWKVLSYHGMISNKKSAYLCECTLCGFQKLVRTDKLVTGSTTKCLNCRSGKNKEEEE